MNTSSNSHSNPKAIIVTWQNLPSQLVARLPEQVKAQMSQWEQQHGASEEAKTRINELTPIASRQHSPNTKKAATIILGSLSAIAFSAGAQTLTSRLGNFSIPAALIMGGAAGILADTKATKVITHNRLKNSTLQAIKDIEKQKKVNPPHNEIGEQFYQSQTALVHKIEGKHLQNTPVFDVVLAGGLSAAEYTMSLSIVTGLGLPGGFILNAIAASLPVAMLWAAASIQSEQFEVPEKVRDLPNQYQPHVVHHIPEQEQRQMHLIEEEIDDTQRQIQYENALETQRQKYIQEGDSSGRLKNWSMAESQFNIDWHKDEKLGLEKERDEQIEKRLFQLQEARAKIEQNYQQPVGNFAPDEVTNSRKKWVKGQEEILKENAAQELKWLHRKYETRINHCEEEIATAQQRYNEAYQRWETENNPNNNLGNVA